MRASYWAALAAVFVVGCSSVESAGRNAERAPPPLATNPAPPPPTNTAPPTAAPPVAAPNVSVAAPPPPPRRDDDADIVVPGVREQQVPEPADPRSNGERMEDIRAWDTCVMRVQGLAEDPTRPQLDTPEDVCRRSLGMSSRTGVPDSRRTRRR